MTLTVDIELDHDARILSAGAAPLAQGGAGGQWSTAWSRTGITAQHKANLNSASEAWSAIKYNDALATSLSGGDIFAGDLGVSGQSAATSAVKQEVDGAEGLRFVLAEAASAVAINFSSFYARDDGTGYAEGARVRLFDAAGTLVGESFVKANGASGQQLLQLGSSVAFRSVELSAGAQRADGSFSHGAYWNSDGTFGSDIYADAAKARHGSDFLVDAISFQLARPEAAADAYALTEDAAPQRFASVLLNDGGNGSGALSAVLATGPAHGRLTLNPDGSFDYQPDADFFGFDAFTYRAFDGKDYSTPARVELTVAALNDAPIAQDDIATTAEDTPVLIDVLANDVAGPANESGQQLTITAAQAAHGSVTVSADGQLVYTPDANYFGADQITYTVTDNGSSAGIPAFLSATAQVDITVTGVNDAPVAVAQTNATDEDTVVTGNLLGSYDGGRDMDPDGDALVVTAATVTTALGALVIIGQDGSYTYDPRGAAALQALNEGASLTDSFAYTVSDGHGGSSTAEVQISVEGKADAAGAPVLAPQVGLDVPLTYYLNYSVGRDESKWIALDAVALDVSHSGDPAGGGGKASASALSVSFGSGSARADFTQKLVSGSVNQEAAVEAYRADAHGTLHLVQAYQIREFTVSSVRTLDIAGVTSTDVQLTFDKLVQSAYSSGSDGAPGHASVGWDFSGNGAIGGPAGAGGRAPIDAAPALQPELDYYVRLDDKSGWLALNDFSMGLDADNGDISASDVLMSLGGSNALTRMLEKLLKGSPLPTIEVEAYARGGASPRLVDEFIFHEVMVSGLADHGGTDNDLALAYGSFTHGHRDLDADGAAAGWTLTGYERGTGTPIAAPTPQASAASGSAIAALAQTDADADAPMTYFLTYGSKTGGPGKPPPPGKKIEVDAFQIDFGNGGYQETADGAPGRAFSSALATSFKDGDASTQLTELLVTGKPVPEVLLEAWRTGADGRLQLVQEYRFDNVQVTAMNTTQASSGTSTGVEFIFDKLARSTWSPNAKVVLEKEDVAWDFKGDGIGFSIENAPPSAAKPALQTELDYYVRFDGSAGWLALDDFSMALDLDEGALAASDVSMLLGSSGVLTGMLSKLLKGVQVPVVEVEAYARGSATPRLVDEYVFRKVLVNSLDSSDVNHNSLGLAYTSFTHAHQNYSANGAASTWTETGYDHATGTSIDGARPHADAALGAGIAVTAQTDPDVPLTYYLTYDSAGSSKRIEVDSLQLNFANSGAPSLGSGGSDHASASTLATSFGAGAASAELTAMIVSGKPFPTMVVEAWRGGADGQLQQVQKYQLSGVQVVDLATREIAGGTSTGAQFTFDQFTQTTTTYDSAGKASSQTIAWDMANNAGGYALAHETLPTAAPGKQPALDYYVRQSDSSGWLALDDFSLGWERASDTLSSSEVSMLLGSSPVLTSMLESLLKGRHIESVEVEAYAHDGANLRLVDEYIFSEVVFTSLASKGMNDNTLGLSYTGFTHGHQDYDAAGLATGWTGTGYDHEHDVVIVAPAPHADFPFA